jgi:hypothetical protein
MIPRIMGVISRSASRGIGVGRKGVIRALLGSTRTGALRRCSAGKIIAPVREGEFAVVRIVPGIEFTLDGASNHAPARAQVNLKCRNATGLIVRMLHGHPPVGTIT